MIDPDAVTRLPERQKIDLLKRLAENEYQEEDAEELCRTLMQDPSPSVRRLAIEGLWGATDPRHIEALIAVVRSDRDPEVRASAASVLGTYVYHGMEQEVLPPFYYRVRNFLVETVRDERNDMLLRRSALEAVSFDGGEDVADLIKWAYAHSDRELNLSAIFAMGRNHYDRWVEYLWKELSGDDRERKLEAVNAARDGWMRRLTPLLRNLAMSADREIAIAAIWALARAGGPGALEQLELCAESSDEDIRRNAADAIIEYQGYQSSDDESGLDDEDWYSS